MRSDTAIVPGAITIAVTSGKGGVGKTSTAVALAAALTRRGVDVVVIDGDIYGPNVHLISEVASCTLGVQTEPLTLTLPASPLGFRVITPVSVVEKDRAAQPSMADLFALAQFADPTQVVIVDMPPGWTKQHTDVCTTLPDMIVAVVAPTAPALADHERHLAQWKTTWASTVQSRRNSDKRRKLVLPEAPTVVTVETMARFTGIPDGGSEPVTIRRLDALPAATVAATAQPLVSVPATASAQEAAGTAEIGRLADAIMVPVPA